MALDKSQPKFTLPASTARVADISRLAFELEHLDNYLREASVRQTGNAMALPKLSSELNEVADSNSLNLLESQHRDYLLKTLGWLRENAPQVHVSFASVPSQQFITKLASWFRDNVSPTLLLSVGLQPTVGVGCNLRTTNKVFDLSLKQRFAAQKQALVQQLSGQQMAVGKTNAQPVEAPTQ